MTTTTKKPTTRTNRKTSVKKTTVSTNKTPQKKIELNSNSFVHEILSAVDGERIKAKKLEILKSYDSENHLKALFIWNFDDSVISVLPEGKVPFQPLTDEAIGKAGVTGVPPHSTLRKEWRKLYNFVKGGNDGMNTLRRETMFINILESLHPEEAEILCLVKDKKLSDKYKITKELVSEAYPDIQWGNRS